MLCHCLALVFLGITRSIEAALVFTQEPANTLYFQEGSTANLTWTYTVDNRKTELARIIWSVLSKTDNLFETLILEDKNGSVKYNPNPLPTYGPERVSKEGQASLVIKNVTFNDSTIYRCLLDGETGIASAQSSVEVIVTGHPFVFPLVKYIKEGENATLTCNATGVPGQNITWKRKTKQDEFQIVNDEKYDIISSGSGTSQLTVKDVSINDSDYFVCDTSAIANQLSSARGFLGVGSFGKSFDACPSTNQSASKNVSTTICCPVRGFPPPEVTWKRPDGTEHKTGNTILPITPEAKDFGTYRCSAKGLNPEPVVILISLHEAGLPSYRIIEDVTKKTELKPGDKFSWTEVPDAVDYLIKISGNEVEEESPLLGIANHTSLEIPYYSLHRKKTHNEGDPLDIVIEVWALGNGAVEGKGGPFKKKILSAATAPKAFFLSVILLFVLAVNLQ